MCTGFAPNQVRICFIIRLSKEGGKYALSELLDLMTRNIQIQQPYKYVESASKQHITCVQMIVSVCIGLLAYIIIILFSKRKKNKK